MIGQAPLGEVTAAMLFAPDAWDQGLIGKAVADAERLGLVGIAAVPRRMSRADAISLYAGYTSFTAAEGRTHAQWLMPDLYTRGISLLVLFAGLADDALVCLKAAKGRSTRTLRDAHSLRSLSNLTDRCFGLFHAPDTRAELRQMVEIFVGSEALTAVEKWRSLPRLRHEQLRDLTRREHLDDRDHQPDLVLQLLQQGIARVALDPMLSALTGDIAPFADAVEAVVLRWRHERCECQLWRQLGELFPITPRYNLGDGGMGSGWRAREREALALSLTSALRELCCEPHYEPQLARYVQSVFEAASLPLGRWSTHRLRLLMSFPRDV